MELFGRLFRDAFMKRVLKKNNNNNTAAGEKSLTMTIEESIAQMSFGNLSPGFAGITFFLFFSFAASLKKIFLHLKKK